MPEPCAFLSHDLPACSVIRPTSDALAGARAAVRALTASRLFEGQSGEFMSILGDLAAQADYANRGF
jgi:hypothetical protein